MDKDQVSMKCLDCSVIVDEVLSRLFGKQNCILFKQSVSVAALCNFKIYVGHADSLTMAFRCAEREKNNIKFSLLHRVVLPFPSRNLAMGQLSFKFTV